MSELIVSSRPDLRRPGSHRRVPRLERRRRGATLERPLPAKQLGARGVRRIDPEDFYDFQEVRPIVSLGEDVTAASRGRNTFALPRCRAAANRRDPARRRAADPLEALLAQRARGRAGQRDRARRDARWAARRHAPHPARAGDAARATARSSKSSASRRRRYEGPTGIVGVLLDACRQAELPSVSYCGRPCRTTSRSRRARAPRSRSAARLGDLIGSRDRPRRSSKRRAEEYNEQVTEAVASDAEDRRLRRGARAQGRPDGGS